MPAVVPPPVEPAGIAELPAAVLDRATLTEAFQAVTTAAVQALPGVRSASITRQLGRRLVTVTATDEVASAADGLQYELGTGPCVTAVVERVVCESPDLAAERRWQPFGSQAARRWGIASVLSLPLGTVTDADLHAGLTLYGTTARALDGTARRLATSLVTATTPALLAVLYRERARTLAVGLDSNREIGVAVGVLMVTHQLTREQAFQALRTASQTRNRKLHEVATDVADLGTLDPPRPRRGRGHHGHRGGHSRPTGCDDEPSGARP